MEQMPPQIAGALKLVMGAVGRLVKDGKNNHGGYSYASTDAFFEAINPACSEAGLIVKPRATSVSIETFEVTEKNTGKPIQKRMVVGRYNFVLIHESGATWCDDLDTRMVALDFTGPQSFGAVESYAVKTFLRSLFLVATGDKDADSQEQFQAEVIRASVKAAKTKNETGEAQVIMDFGQGLEPMPAKDVATRVMSYLVEIGQEDGAKWWAEQKTGREQFHDQFPKLALDLKRKVEGFFAPAQEAAE
jgi:hypothetical protein